MITWDPGVLNSFYGVLSQCGIFARYVLSCAFPNLWVCTLVSCVCMPSLGGQRGTCEFVLDCFCSLISEPFLSKLVVLLCIVLLMMLITRPTSLSVHDVAVPCVIPEAY